MTTVRDGYADWWQVRALDGTRLGRRETAHAHGTQEFTRSADVEVPGEHACVVVRGHDQTHEYGGQAMLVNVDSGSTAVENPGSEPRSFSRRTVPSDPQYRSLIGTLKGHRIACSGNDRHHRR